MKILYVITSTDVGGAEKALLQLVQQMAKQHSVEVISLKPLGPIGKKLESAGAQKVFSLNMAYGGVGIVSALSAEIAAFQPDIVHAMLFRAILFARCACAGKPCKLVTTPHFDLSKKNFILRGLDRFLKVVDKVSVTESKQTADYLISHQKYDKNKVIYIGNSPEEGKFFPSQDVRLAMRAKYGYTPQQLVFLCVARLAPVKNHMGLLRAFSKVYSKNPHIRLVFVGEGILRSEIEKFIQQNGLEKAVLLAGEQDNINDWLNMADVFVLNSKEESLPLSLLEALQAGKPCLVSNVGDVACWVEHGKNGFLYSAKSEVLLCCFLAEIAEKAKNSPDFLQKMGQFSLQKAGEIKPDFQQYQQLYTQLKGGKFSRENF